MSESLETFVDSAPQDGIRKRSKSQFLAKKPLSAYNFFFREKRAQLLQVKLDQYDPNKKQRRVHRKGKVESPPLLVLTQQISAMWKECSAEDRAKYEELAAEDNRRYRQECSQFKVTKRQEKSTDLKRSADTCSYMISNAQRPLPSAHLPQAAPFHTAHGSNHAAQNGLYSFNANGAGTDPYPYSYSPQVFPRDPVAYSSNIRKLTGRETSRVTEVNAMPPPPPPPPPPPRSTVEFNDLMRSSALDSSYRHILQQQEIIRLMENQYIENMHSINQRIHEQKRRSAIDPAKASCPSKRYNFPHHPMNHTLYPLTNELHQMNRIGHSYSLLNSSSSSSSRNPPLSNIHTATTHGPESLAPVLPPSFESRHSSLIHPPSVPFHNIIKNNNHNTLMDYHPRKELDALYPPSLTTSVIPYNMQQLDRYQNNMMPYPSAAGTNTKIAKRFVDFNRRPDTLDFSSSAEIVLSSSIPPIDPPRSTPETIMNHDSALSQQIPNNSGLDLLSNLCGRDMASR